MRISNFQELANLSTLELINNAGSPSSQKLFVLWNPSLATRTVSLDEGQSNEDNSRKSLSPISEVACMFAEMVQHGLRCIAFCGSRNLCELVLCYTREILEEIAPHMVNSIRAYRAGYTSEIKVFLEPAKTTKKIVLRLQCQACKQMSNHPIKMCKHFEIGGDKKGKGTSLF